jgi:hypothetical protein
MIVEKMGYRINIGYFILLLEFLTSVVLSQDNSLKTVDDTVKISYWDVYEQFMDLEIDPGQVAEIKAPFVLQRDVGKFILEKGKLYLCKPVEERVCAAFFSGKGSFSFTPPTDVEKQQLNRFYGADTFETGFKALFIIFADTTLEEVQKNFKVAKGKASRSDQDLVEYALKYLSQKKGKRFDHQIMKTLLDNDYNGFFYAHFSKKKTDPLFFEINPFSEEEVRFMRRLEGPSFYYLPELINQFHLQSDYANNIHLAHEDKSSLQVKNYNIDCTLEGSSLKFSAITEMEFEAKKDNQNWLYFYLFEELEVDSLFWGNGHKATYVKEKDNPFLWVKCVHPLKSGEIRKLRVHYHGKLIERLKDWFYIKSPRNWYPKDDGYRTRADFDVTYHIPKDFQFAGTGKLVFKEINDDVVTSRWVSGRSIPNSSFNIGFFEEHKIENDSIPPITVYMAATGHQELAHSLALQGIGSGTNMLEKVGEDVANSIQLFQNIFGNAADDHFYATEIPYLHGEAFPGLIHLAWQTFQMESEEGDNEIFRAHETAHQWWGIGVDFKTYHDQWLSEAFAEYCGWWYLHEVVKKEEKDEKKFYKMLERLRKEIIGNRNYFFGKGKKAGPIWLGYRTLSSDTQGDFRLIIYKKGAWVMHMLRFMCLDLETMSDEHFRDLLRGFYQKYFDQKTSTEDFQAYAESFLGEDLEWFFQQWVYGTDVPEYKFDYEILPADGGQFKVKGEVEQSEVAADFQMPVFIGVDFGDDEIIPERVWVKGPVTIFELGSYSKEPKKVIFNHLESVLCEIK